MCAGAEQGKGWKKFWIIFLTGFKINF
jgi:hypothetical protein